MIYVLIVVYLGTKQPTIDMQQFNNYESCVQAKKFITQKMLILRVDDLYTKCIGDSDYETVSKD